jgi:branched-chain amino acid transport system ATP-binding protein
VEKGIIHVPEGRKLFPELTVIDNLLMGAYTIPQSERPKRLERVFSVFLFSKNGGSKLRGRYREGNSRWWQLVEA